MVRVWCLALMGLVVRADDLMQMSGSSTLHKGRLRSCVVGSMTGAAPGGTATLNGTALLEDSQGGMTTLPCSLEAFPGAEPDTEDVVWKLTLPFSSVLRRLTLKRGATVVADFEAPRKAAAPSIEFMDSLTGSASSLAWVLKRDKAFQGGSYWVRWSLDGGRTWQREAQLYPGSESAAQLDFPTSVPARGALVEVWVPQGITLHPFRHVMGSR